MIALDFFAIRALTQGLDFIFMWEFCCAVPSGLLPWPLLTTFTQLSISDFIPPGLDFFCCS